MLVKKWQFIVFTITCILQAHGADKYTDENRPYEFGFKIEGEQHRHEKKDENGLIMGEFGFITADGVYHVTVYATDENGNFKILSMKNIRVKPYPSGPERTGHSLPFPPSQNPPQTQGPPASQNPSQTKGPAALQNTPQAQGSVSNVAKPVPPSPAKSCSHCSLPTTTTTTERLQLTDYAIVSNNPSNNGFGGSGATVPQYSQNTQQNNPDPINTNGGIQNYPDVGLNGNVPEIGSRFNIPDQPGDELEKNYQQDKVYNQVPQQNSVQSPEKTLQAPFTNSPGDRNPKQFTDYSEQLPGAQKSQQPGNDQYNPTIFGSQQPQLSQGSQRPQQSINPESRFGPQATEVSQGPIGPSGIQGPQGSLELPNPSGRQGAFEPRGTNDIQGSQGTQNSQNPLLNKPTLISAQMQIVDKNTDIRLKRPGEMDGLPNGLTKDDMLQLLYTFNYTVGFHGHFEEGYTNGAKQGYYYVTGRNGVRMRVDYVADENGFRPKITQEVLDLLSDDVPNPETEKDEKYGLKGYEFKWLYYPVGSKS